MLILACALVIAPSAFAAQAKPITSEVLDGKTKAEASALGVGRKVEVEFFMAGALLLPSAAHLI
ncbi:MAG: hypothetical protein CK533_05565 [Acidobacterium sp.]|nr:hypothetical protein [Acidobacteriota bacterium]PHY11172.1 MAG: hypothetical protein CK533_05565 [Acidobacterium sp.]